MGLRFRKSIKVAPGVKLNLGKKSAGISVGTKGARYSVNSSGRRTTTVGIPGTGLSYQDISTKKKKTVNKSVEYVDNYDDFDEEIEYEAEFTPPPEPEVSGAALTNLKTRQNCFHSNHDCPCSCFRSTRSHSSVHPVYHCGSLVSEGLQEENINHGSEAESTGRTNRIMKTLSRLDGRGLPRVA